MSYLSYFNDPALLDWIATLAMPIGISLIVAGLLSLWSGRLLDLAPGHKLWAFILGFAVLCSLSTMPLTQHKSWTDTFIIFLFPLLVVFIYFFPTVAALSARHPSFRSIFIMNVFFGWTGAGWIVAFFWAVRKPTPVETEDYRITPFGAVPRRPTGGGSSRQSS